MELFKVELVKIKRMSVYQLAVLSPLLSIIIGARSYGFMKTKVAKVNPWQVMGTIAPITFVGMLLPILIIYVTMTIGRMENANNGWKQLLAMPVKRSKVYLTKYFLVLSVIIVALIAYLIEYILGAYFLGAKGMIPTEVIVKMIYIFIAIQPFTALLFLLSNKFNSVIIPLGVGMITVLSSLIIVQSSYWKYAPWTYALSLSQGEINIIQALPLLFISLLIFSIIFSLDIINFNKKDVI
ncbi:ABC transporter permease [Clostridium felsineum]|uniref:Uncharacterized protein n=1 Tax=Clostridium felsineum TaxID=36839 RepID=A0A1S8L9D1_9CLOT|nr:ABC transporter permease [Clostridium felsineum]URZ05178.1 hypothetical protein CLROS_005020 [Clostridium felsineum]URZ10219.1 hypothetical protein CROST_009270 [Clostridium felsineum]